MTPRTSIGTVLVTRTVEADAGADPNSSLSSRTAKYEAETVTCVDATVVPVASSSSTVATASTGSMFCSATPYVVDAAGAGMATVAELTSLGGSSGITRVMTGS